MSRILERLALSVACVFVTPFAQSQTTFDVRGSGPFSTLVDGADNRSYGMIRLRCDAGRCTLLKTTFLCDREDAFFDQAVATADRVRTLRAPASSQHKSLLVIEIDDFGSKYSCSFALNRGAAPGGNSTFHVDSYECAHIGSDGRRRVERSMETLDIKKVCKTIILKKSPW